MFLIELLWGRSRTTIEALGVFLAPDPENELISIKRRLSDDEKLLEGMRSANSPDVYSLKLPKAVDRRGPIALSGVTVLCPVGRVAGVLQDR